MTEFKNQFPLEEYKALRDEIMQHMRQIYYTETIGAVAVVSLYAWLVLPDHQKMSYEMWFIPPLVIVLSGLRVIDLNVRLTLFGRYIKTIEEALLRDGPPPQGWEHWKKSSSKIDVRATVVTTIGWIIVLSLSIAASIWLTR